MKPNLPELFRYVYGELGEEERKRVEERIRSDVAWRQAYEECTRLSKGLSEPKPRFGEHVPYGYWDNFHGRLMDRLHGRRTSPAMSRWGRGLAWAASAAVVGLVLTVVLRSGGEVEYIAGMDSWFNSENVRQTLENYYAPAIDEDDWSSRLDDLKVVDWTSDEDAVEGMDALTDFGNLSTEQQRVIVEQLKTEDII
jgi:hypothetical protein